ncbi:hypothetical protein GCM10009789_68930 [Kribbella sancticallisti]|uniref:Uncharacterized protein n=1 Tax=Kribbella sancticallisti TaxID=460087 RepID=A0ABN2EFE9_9ACTN
MKSIRYAVLAAAAGLVLTGCGDESDPGAGASPSASSSSMPTPGSPTSGTPTTGTPGALPLTVTRTGGFAGFDDHIVVGTDGITSIGSRGKDPVRCKLEAGFLNTLTTAAGQVDWASVGVTKPTVRHPDDMIVAVGAGGGLARLEDPKLKPLAAPVSTLLTEAAAPGKLCKPV